MSCLFIVYRAPFRVPLHYAGSGVERVARPGRGAPRPAVTGAESTGQSEPSRPAGGALPSPRAYQSAACPSPAQNVYYLFFKLTRILPVDENNDHIVQGP